MLGYPPDIPWLDFPATQLLGIRSFAHGITQQAFAALAIIHSAFFLLLMYIILRRERIAVVVLWLIMAVALSLTHETVVSAVRGTRRFVIGLAVIPLRFVGAHLSAILLHLMIFFPITSDFSAWYAGDYILAIIVALALVVFRLLHVPGGSTSVPARALPDY